MGDTKGTCLESIRAIFVFSHPPTSVDFFFTEESGARGHMAPKLYACSKCGTTKSGPGGLCKNDECVMSKPPSERPPSETKRLVKADKEESAPDANTPEGGVSPDLKALQDEVMGAVTNTLMPRIAEKVSRFAAEQIKERIDKMHAELCKEPTVATSDEELEKVQEQARRYKRQRDEARKELEDLKAKKAKGAVSDSEE